MVRADGENNLEHREWLQLFSQTIEDVRNEMKAQGRSDEFVGAKVRGYA